MKVVHKLPHDEIDERMQGQASTAKKCPHCLNYNTRIHRHMKICKKKPKTKVGRKKKTEEEEEVCDLMGALKAYDARNPRKLAEKTRKKHLSYAKIILSEYQPEYAGKVYCCYVWVQGRGQGGGH